MSEPDGACRPKAARHGGQSRRPLSVGEARLWFGANAQCLRCLVRAGHDRDGLVGRGACWVVAARSQPPGCRVHPRSDAERHQAIRDLTHRGLRVQEDRCVLFTVMMSSWWDGTASGAAPALACVGPAIEDMCTARRNVAHRRDGSSALRRTATTWRGCARRSGDATRRQGRWSTESGDGRAALRVHVGGSS